MNHKIKSIGWVFVLFAIGFSLPGCDHNPTSSSILVQESHIVLHDSIRNRDIPLQLYFSNDSVWLAQKQKIAIICHGYGGENTAYSFIAHHLVASGYFVASIQHQLPGDEPIAATGNVFEQRMPHWQQGIQTIGFVLNYFRKTKPELLYDSLLLLGHSHGGDMVMLFAKTYSDQVGHVITLDHRRMPIPLLSHPRILTIRSSDQKPDARVLPSASEADALNIKIVYMPDMLHNEMYDGATTSQKAMILGYITDFLSKDLPSVQQSDIDIQK